MSIVLDSHPFVRTAYECFRDSPFSLLALPTTLPTGTENLRWAMWPCLSYTPAALLGDFNEPCSTASAWPHQTPRWVFVELTHISAKGQSLHCSWVVRHPSLFLPTLLFIPVLPTLLTSDSCIDACYLYINGFLTVRDVLWPFHSVWRVFQCLKFRKSLEQVSYFHCY